MAFLPLFCIARSWKRPFIIVMLHALVGLSEVPVAFDSHWVDNIRGAGEVEDLCLTTETQRTLREAGSQPCVLVYRQGLFGG